MLIVENESFARRFLDDLAQQTHTLENRCENGNEGKKQNRT